MEINIPAMTPFEYISPGETHYEGTRSLIDRTLEVQNITEGFVYGIIYIGGSPFDVRIPIQLARELEEPGEVYYLTTKKPNPNLPPI